MTDTAKTNEQSTRWGVMVDQGRDADRALKGNLRGEGHTFYQAREGKVSLWRLRETLKEEKDSGRRR